MENNNGIHIVTIKNINPLYRGVEVANAVELIELKEFGYEIVAKKGLYQIGSKAILVLTDYLLSDIPIFESYIRPNGVEKDSRLGLVEGKKRRVRATKFNLSKVPNGDCTYSNGILLTMTEVVNYLAVIDVNVHSNQFDFRNLGAILGITKYYEKIVVGGDYDAFPEGLYKTDETNINNLWDKIEFPITLIGTEKIDGSSITIGITPRDSEGFICSRNLRRKLKIKSLEGQRLPTFREKIKKWFGFDTDLNVYTLSDNPDKFVKYGLPILNKLKELGYDNLILRGELCGRGIDGSGNKNNPYSNWDIRIKFFSIDVINKSGYAEKMEYSSFKRLCSKLDLLSARRIFFYKFGSKEELLVMCDDYFKKDMIEGIVVQSEDNKFRAKIMNLEYDSKK